MAASIELRALNVEDTLQNARLLPKQIGHGTRHQVGDAHHDKNVDTMPTDAGQAVEIPERTGSKVD